MIFNLFKYLKESNIPFALTNGYKDVVSQKDTQADIDMIFKKKDFKSIKIILQGFCKINNLQLVQVLHHDLYAKNIFLFNPNDMTFLNLDIYADFSRKNLSFFSEEAIFNTLKSYQNIPIVSAEKEFIAYLYKKIDKNDLSLENFNHLYELYKQEKLCEKELENFFPKTFSIIKESFILDKIEIILNNRKKLLEDINRLKFISLNTKFKNLLRTIKRILNPTGITVSFLGPDGSGKSTVINNILKARLPFRRDDYFHTKPIVVNNLEQTVQSEPHKHKVYSPIKSYMKIIYFIFQYNQGWIKNILPLKIKSSFIIFDRYFDDILVDQKRYRYGGDIKFLKFARFLIPIPELYFILTTDPEIIFERKKEVEFNELKRQVKEYKELAISDKYYNIDVSKTPDEIASEIIKIIMNRMSKRYTNGEK